MGTNLGLRRARGGRWVCCWAALALVAWAATAISPAMLRPAVAQDADPLATPDAKSSAPARGAEPASQSVLTFIFESLGWRYTIAFLAISFTLVAFMVMNILASRRDNIVPLALVQGFEQHLNDKRYQEAYELARTDDSFLGQVLSAGLAKLSAGYAPAIEAMQEVGEEETMKLEHRLSYIALLASIAPMVGLLGTVDGMTLAFMKIAQSGGGTPDPVLLAKDISTALVTTVFGLVLAIPAIILYGILKNRMQRLTLEVGIVSEQLMSRFQNVGVKKPAAGAAPPPGGGATT